jgi:hypothetical protein
MGSLLIEELIFDENHNTLHKYNMALAIDKEQNIELWASQ